MAAFCANGQRTGFAGPPDLAALTQRISALAEDQWLLRGELWLAVSAREDAPSTEQTLRGPDDAVSACMVLETADEPEARTAANEGAAQLDGAQRPGIYRLLCTLHGGDEI